MAALKFRATDFYAGFVKLSSNNLSDGAQRKIASARRAASMKMLFTGGGGNATNKQNEELPLNQKFPVFCICSTNAQLAKIEIHTQKITSAVICTEITVLCVLKTVSTIYYFAL